MCTLKNFALLLKKISKKHQLTSKNIIKKKFALKESINKKLFEYNFTF